MSLRSVLIATAPLAGAVGIFGVVFGAAGSAEFGGELTIAMSLFVFSGTVQFAVLGLLISGAGTVAIVLTVLALNARNLVFGATLRSHLRARPWQRAALGWFLIDESFGLALTAGPRAGTVLLIAGGACYVAWQAGTLLGVAGARLIDLEGIAAAVFPVLFIGLAALTAGGRVGMARAAFAGVLVLGLAVAVPGIRAFLPILVAVAVALPEPRS